MIAKGFIKMWKYSNKYHKSKQQKKFLSKLCKTDWLTLVDNMILAALTIRKIFTPREIFIETGATIKSMRAGNVLIYCKNGQLGSAVLSSLAQVVLDPFYRTRDGLRALINKEWIYFEHNFVKYMNLANEEAQEAQFCPAFILLLECIHQLIV
jgi:hypothetical protein